MGESRKIKLGDWAITPTQNLLQRAGKSVRITPRAMDVLVYLANHAGEVVSADELIDSVWQGRTVGDTTVYQSITQLRHALGDSTEESRFIETIPKRGYRLVAPVTMVEPEGQSSDVAVDRVSSRKLGFAIAGVLALTLVVLAVLYINDVQRDVLPNSVAILPFENLSPDPNNAYFADGIHEELLNQLGKLSELNVIARTSMRQYANTEKSIPEIAEELNVETVMEGSLRYDAGRIRITVQLNDGVTGTHIWSETYDRKLTDIFVIQEQIAVSVAGALGVRLGVGGVNAFKGAGTQNIEAYEAYLQ